MFPKSEKTTMFFNVFLKMVALQASSRDPPPLAETGHPNGRQQIEAIAPMPTM